MSEADVRWSRVVSGCCLLLVLVGCEPRHHTRRSAVTGTTLHATSAATGGPPSLAAAPSASTPAGSPSSGSKATAPAKPNPRIIGRVAWKDAPVAVNSRVATGYTLPTTLTSAPVCRLRDVETVPTFGPGLGTVYGALHVHNLSETACSLSGRTRLAMVDGRGVVWQSTGERAALGEAAAPAVILAPNSWARSQAWPIGSSCGGFGVTTQLVLSLPGDRGKRTVPFKVGWPLLPHCDPPGRAPRPRPGRLDRPSFYQIDAGDAGVALASFGRLNVLLDVPSTVRAGATLDYSLVLWNDDVNGGLIDNQACPLFEQRLVDIVPVTTSQELSCGDAVALGPGEGVSYAMRLDVPADAPQGSATLEFRFVEPLLPPVTAQVTITRDSAQSGLPAAPGSPSVSRTSTPALPRTDLADGRHPAFLRRIDGAGHTITIDAVQFFDGKAAVTAATEDGQDNRVDFYIRNANPGLRTLAVARGAVLLVNLLEPDPVNVGRLLSVPWQRFAAYNKVLGSYTVVWMTVTNGRVTRLEQQYIP
jgi:hypothetical protein